MPMYSYTQQYVRVHYAHYPCHQSYFVLNTRLLYCMLYFADDIFKFPALCNCLIFFFILMSSMVWRIDFFQSTRVFRAEVRLCSWASEVVWRKAVSTSSSSVCESVSTPTFPLLYPVFHAYKYRLSAYRVNFSELNRAKTLFPDAYQ